MVLQKLNKDYKDKETLAKVYYTILFKINQIEVRPKEIDLISFMALNGTISTPPLKDKFIEQYKVPKNSIYNMVARLQKLHILVKDKERKIRVNSVILPNFEDLPLLLQIKLNLKEVIGGE